jgi:hypothetical protein
MTMEVWRLAVSVGNYRLALLIVTTIATAVVLEYHLGFRQNASSWGRRLWMRAWRCSSASPWPA